MLGNLPKERQFVRRLLKKVALHLVLRKRKSKSFKPEIKRQKQILLEWLIQKTMTKVMRHLHLISNLCNSFQTMMVPRTLQSTMVLPDLQIKIRIGEMRHTGAFPRM